MKLAIISHTPHYKKDGKIAGWGATVREINHMTKIFDVIYHIAPLHEGEPPESSLFYENEENVDNEDNEDNKKIKFVALKPYGGQRLKDKFSILKTALFNLSKIKNILDKVDWVQFRAPTAMGLYVLPYLSIRSKPKKWIKYAGNWNMKNPPLSYKFQKWWLNNNFQNSKVTINGQWKDQKEHLINFQNPCLDNEELERAKNIAKEKNFNGNLILCFVGTLTKNKGVDLIIDALSKIEHKNEIKEVIFAGDSNERKRYEEISSRVNLKIIFKGFVSRKEIENIYKVSHIILLPSESEGFPKVIAEAAAYGCIPIVSDVSSISQYFNDTNAFLLKKINSEELTEKINFALKDRVKLKEMSNKNADVVELFTFENYLKNLKEKILID